jgi:crossover junction endodeoxyribonuclease RuvC
MRRVVVGIDPGLGVSGWGVVESVADCMACVGYGTITTSSSDRLEYRLVKIFDMICEVIKQYDPTDIAMESVFVNMNPRASEKLIMARTASFLARSKMGLMVNEYTPNTVKKNVTGSGHAPKLQVYMMVQKILNLEPGIRIKSDSTDALAVAVCHSFASKSQS